MKRRRIERYLFLVATTMQHALSEWNLFNAFIKLIEAGMISAIIFSWEKMAKCTKVVVGIVKELTLLAGTVMPSVLLSACQMTVVMCSLLSLLGICIIGDFTSAPPNAKAQNAVRAWINCGVERGHVTPVHYIITHRQSQRPGYTEWWANVWKMFSSFW